MGRCFCDAKLPPVLPRLGAGPIVSGLRPGRHGQGDFSVEAARYADIHVHIYIYICLCFSIPMYLCTYTHLQVGSSEVGSFHTPPTRLLSALRSCWEWYGSLMRD